MKNFNQDGKSKPAPRPCPDFGQRANHSSTWDTAYDTDSTRERMVMVAEFHTWLVKTRIDTEKKLLSSERNQREYAPFAAAGLEAAATPQDVPLCVVEFAQTCLETLDYKRKLDLLNVYYLQAARDISETLMIEPGNEAEVNALWDWFIQERGEGKEKK